MLTPKQHIPLLILIAVVGLAACQTKGPSPAEAPSPVEASPAQAPPPAKASPSQPTGQARPGSLRFTPPANWESQAVTSSMRKAQFRIPGASGDAELVVYYFGPQGAGSAEANFDRWVTQFKNPDGSPITDAQPTRREINGIDVTTVEVAGRYVAAMRPGAAERQDKAEQRLLAAIVQTKEGPYYLKMVGPDATVSQSRSGFEQLLKSIEPGQ